MGSWEAGLWSADAQRDSWEKGNLVQNSTFPLRNRTKIVQSHHSSDIFTQSTACSATFLFWIRANGLPLLLGFLRWLKCMYEVQLSQGGLQQCHNGCILLLFPGLSLRNKDLCNYFESAETAV